MRRSGRKDRVSVIITGVAVVCGVGGRRGRSECRRTVRRDVSLWLIQDGLGPCEMINVHESEVAVMRLLKRLAAYDLYRPPLCYRERRRLAKLRRRARDREVACILAKYEGTAKIRGTERRWGHLGGLWGSRHYGARTEAAWILYNGGLAINGMKWPPKAWWSTAEGRRHWMNRRRSNS